MIFGFSAGLIGHRNLTPEIIQKQSRIMSFGFNHIHLAAAVRAISMTMYSRTDKACK